MFRKLGSYRPRHATVVAYLALFVALGGSSYAAISIGSGNIRNSSIRSEDIGTGQVHSSDIRNNDVQGIDIANSAIGTTDVKNHSLLATDFAPGQLPAGAQGAQGPQGLKGDKGDKGDAGPAGTARGYGLVTIPCTVGGSCPVTQGQNATVSHPFTGVFCIDVPGVPAGQTALSATLADAVAGDYITTITPTPGASCPGLEVVTRNNAGNADKSFFFVVP